jgi:hypothetical protein
LSGAIAAPAIASEALTVEARRTQMHTDLGR